MAQYKIRPKLGVEYKDFLTDWGIRIIEVKGAFDETPKGYYSLDFAEENGLEVYVPSDRKVSNREVSIRGVYYGSDSSLYIEQMKTYLRGNGVLHFWDTHKGIEFDAVYENYETETERFRSDIEFVQFKLTFQKNINSAVDSGFLDEYTEPDLEQLKTDIINAAASATSASDNANEAAESAISASNNANEAAESANIAANSVQEAIDLANTKARLANEAAITANNASDTLLSNVISLEIRDDMHLYMTTPDVYSGFMFKIENGSLIAII